MMSDYKITMATFDVMERQILAEHNDACERNAFTEADEAALALQDVHMRRATVMGAHSNSRLNRG